jgi:hypothetical protein
MDTHMLIWGWLRLALSLIQTSSSVAAILLLIYRGFVPVTWLFILTASLATLSSRLLYKGRAERRLAKQSESTNRNS